MTGIRIIPSSPFRLDCENRDLIQTGVYAVDPAPADFVMLQLSAGIDLRFTEARCDESGAATCLMAPPVTSRSIVSTASEIGFQSDACGLREDVGCRVAADYVEDVQGSMTFDYDRTVLRAEFPLIPLRTLLTRVYRWTPSHSGTATFQAIGGDPVIAVLDFADCALGPASGVPLIAIEDDTMGLERGARTSAPVTGGFEYCIYVGAFPDDSAGATIQLDVTLL